MAAVLRVLWIPLLALILIAPTDVFAQRRVKAPPGFVLIKASNKPDFINLGKSGRRTVWCRFQNTRKDVPEVGFVARDRRIKKNLWQNIVTSIKEVRKNRRLTAKKRTKQVAKLKALKDELLLQCIGALGTPVPSATPTATATSDPNATITATPTSTPTTAPGTPTPTATPVPATILQDAAGPQAPFTPTPDSLGRFWAADNDNVVEPTEEYLAPPQVLITSSYPTPYPVEILRTQRYAPTLSYQVPINDGTWDVWMFFAEVNAGPDGTAITGPGQRVFDVQIEGQTVASNVDIYALAGPNAEHRLYFPNIVMTDDNMNIELVAATGSAPVALAVLEIRDPGGTVPHTIGTNFGFEVGAGGNDFTDPVTNVTWQDDSPWVVGQSRGYANFGDSVVGTDDAFLYQTQRYVWSDQALPLSYEYLLPNRTYNVTLGFAEIQASGLVGQVTGPGQRVMDIVMEGNAVQEDFDIFSEAGAFTALDKTFPVAVTDGTLNISLQPTYADPARRNNAAINTIRIDTLNLGVAPTFVNFGTIAAGNVSTPIDVTIRNDATQTITVGAVSISGPQASYFQVAATPPYIIGAGGAPQIQVVYAPPVGASGAATATLNIQTDDNSVVGGLYEVALRGNS